MTNPTAVEDRLDGTVIIANPGSRITVTVQVTADPCPTVEWSLNDNILMNDSMHSISDPCSIVAQIFSFTLTINNFSLPQSGQYSAIFSNLGGSTPLPGLTVTVPGK